MTHSARKVLLTALSGNLILSGSWNQSSAQAGQREARPTGAYAGILLFACAEGGSTTSVEDRENGDLGAVAH